ncbi:MAG: hypothetical protein H0U76_16645 [Ktedonobacteraceae bacterium]|nr:hypothetical protein [Ktedonobacteraceae bacterium]
MPLSKFKKLSHVKLGGFQGKLCSTGRSTDEMQWAGLGSDCKGVIESLHFDALKGNGQKDTWDPTTFAKALPATHYSPHLESHTLRLPQSRTRGCIQQDHQNKLIFSNTKHIRDASQYPQSAQEEPPPPHPSPASDTAQPGPSNQ